MQDNTQRGKRTLFWLKLTFALFISVGVLLLVFLGLLLGSGFFDTNGGDISDSDFWAGIGIAIICALLLFVILFASVAWCISVILWLSWLFRITQNLRKVTTTAVGPWVAVILSGLPYVGTVIHYFIFKNLVKQLEDYLASRQQTSHNSVAEILGRAKPVPMNMVNGFLVASVLSVLTSFVCNDIVSGVLTIVFGIAAYIFYLKSLSSIVIEEKILFDAYNEEQIQSKVDRILREREIEKAAAEVRAAMYETEKSYYDGEVPPPPPPSAN